MIMIPISVFYFVFGFVIGCIFLITLSAYLCSKQEKKREKQVDEYIKKLFQLNKNDNKENELGGKGNE